MSILNIKSVSALLLVGSLSACGGGGTATNPINVVTDPITNEVVDGTFNYSGPEGTISCTDFVCSGNAVYAGMTIPFEGTVTQSGTTYTISGSTDEVDFSLTFNADDNTYELTVDETTIVDVEDVIEVVTPTYVAPGTPDYTFANTDFNYDSLNVVGLEEAHDAGWTGKGVNILIVDSGSHGENVAVTAAIVAPGANTSYWDSQTGETATYNNDFGWGNANIVNHSYGSSIDEYYISQVSVNYWATTANQEVAFEPGALHVWAGPNHYNCAYNTNDYYTAPSAADDSLANECDGVDVAYDQGLLAGTHIFVGAIDGDNVFASVAAGTESALNDNFLVADGNGVLGGFGTSFAAPKVSGAAALIMHKFDSVDAADTANILLDTADDTFAGYSSLQHGQGLLDLNAALSPIGDLN